LLIREAGWREMTADDCKRRHFVYSSESTKWRAQKRQLPLLGQLRGLFCPRDLDALGIRRGHLRAMLRNGEVGQVTHGLYRRCRAPATEHETIAMGLAGRFPRRSSVWSQGCMSVASGCRLPEKDGLCLIAKPGNRVPMDFLCESRGSRGRCSAMPWRPARSRGALSG